MTLLYILLLPSHKIKSSSSLIEAEAIMVAPSQGIQCLGLNVTTFQHYVVLLSESLAHIIRKAANKSRHMHENGSSIIALHVGDAYSSKRPLGSCHKRNLCHPPEDEATS
jgi:hypothetical protein